MTAPGKPSSAQRRVLEALLPELVGNPPVNERTKSVLLDRGWVKIVDIVDGRWLLRITDAGRAAADGWRDI